MAMAWPWVAWTMNGAHCLLVCINTGNDAHLVQQCFVDRTWLKSATTGTPRILPFRSILVGYSAVLLNRAASAWPRYKRNRGLKDSNPAQICSPNLESHSSLVRAGHYRNICGCSASARPEHIYTPERKRRRRMYSYRRRCGGHVIGLPSSPCSSWRMSTLFFLFWDSYLPSGLCPTSLQHVADGATVA